MSSSRSRSSSSSLLFALHHLSIGALLTFLALVVVSVAAVVSDDNCPNVIDGEAVLLEAETNTYRVSATISSPYEKTTSWDQYSDEFRVLDKTEVSGGEAAADGNDDLITVLGTRTLAHPHENEQPFTRSISFLEIPTYTTKIEIEARDSVNGYCGGSTFTIELASGTFSETSSGAGEDDVGDEEDVIDNNSIEDDEDEAAAAVVSPSSPAAGAPPPANLNCFSELVLVVAVTTSMASAFNV